MRILDWDSDFFGVRIARLDTLAGDWAERCAAERVRCAYLLVDAGDAAAIHAAERAAFRLVDIRLTFARPLGSEPSRPVPPPRMELVASRPRVRLARAEDLPALEAIAAQSHSDSRFYFDPRFDPARATALYRVWIRRSCEGQLAQAVYVLDNGEGALGYVTCAKEGSIGLVGLHPQARGKGWAQLLLKAALAWFHEAGLTRATVVTQGRNLGAQKLYQRAGFVSERVELWFHKWFDEEARGDGPQDPVQ